jgi:hypothetical protein
MGTYYPYRVGERMGIMAYKSFVAKGGSPIESHEEAIEKARDLFYIPTRDSEAWDDRMQDDLEKGFIDGFVESWLGIAE